MSEPQLTVASITFAPTQLAALGAAIGKEVPMFWYDIPDRAPRPANDNLPRVVAFTGLAGSGKSTAADYLIRQHGYVRVKFAGPLKAAMAAMGFSQEQIEGNLKETPCAWLNFKTPRYAMQTLGTEWGRKCIGEDFWAELWVHHANNVLAAGKRVVVDDCRFPNEAEAVRSLGGVIIKLEGRGGIAGSHESEAGCGQADAIVENDGCVTGLYAGIEEVIRRAA
ncbi:deoxynucleotide monophosphate kinase [Shinella sp. BYT-45]|uniref:deoxynucleotide monophosphate kinase family protein n=1 Tax=Shinella sp. BYT-45 TaxID=3377377 RepID=UPI0039804BDC